MKKKELAEIVLHESKHNHPELYNPEPELEDEDGDIARGRMLEMEAHDWAREESDNYLEVFINGQSS